MPPLSDEMDAKIELVARAFVETVEHNDPAAAAGEELRPTPYGC